jgi:membrane protein
LVDVNAFIARLDRYQRRESWLGFPFALSRKYSDDQGGYLAATVTYYAFFSLFPLLLVATTVLGFVLRGHQHLAKRIEDSALGQFPIIGRDLQLHTLHGSFTALVIGLLLALWSGTAVCLALEDAMSQVWGIPFRERLSFLRRRGRALLLLLVLGVGAVGTTVLSGLGTVGSSYGTAFRIVAIALSVVFDIGLFWTAFRLLTPGEVSTRSLRAGAIAAGIAWPIIQAAGGLYVGHVVNHASNTYGTFAGVIGLLSFIYLSAHVLLLAAELNVVAAQDLWPRSLSFGDGLQPTEADRRALTELARDAERRPDEDVEVELRR